MTRLLFALPLLLAVNLVQAQNGSTSLQDLQVNTNGKFVVSTVDGNSEFRIGGRLQWDYNQAEENDQVVEDGLDIRRARLYASMAMGDWYYKAQFNIGNGNGGTPEDLYVKYSGLPGGWSATLGRQLEPFGLNQLVSSKDINMLERSAVAELYSFSRSDGLLLSKAVGSSTLSLGLFEDNSDLNGLAATGRATHAFGLGDNSLLHLGANYSSRANNVTNSALELAWVGGPLHIQTEYARSDVAGVEFSGYYLQAGYILTGESLPYSKGVFKQVASSSASGAWEVVVRYESGDGNYSDIELGTTDATATGLGLNYYLNSNIRMGISYTSGEDNTNNDSGSEWRGRFQFAF